jgi:hypothetical protein
MGSKHISIFKLLFYVIAFSILLAVFSGILRLILRLSGLSLLFQRPIFYLCLALFILLVARSGFRNRITYLDPISMPDIKRADILYADRNVVLRDSFFDAYGTLTLSPEWLVYTGRPFAIKIGDIADARKERLSPLTKWLVYWGKDLLKINTTHNEKYSFYVHNAGRWVEELNKIRK